MKNDPLEMKHWFGLTLMASAALFLFNSCATSRPDTVWNEEGVQKGLASWYDDHGDRTANGEIYNMHAMTAAHPSLALNSVVDVINLRNGKAVRVRVNDRLPPIHDGRVIDLSKAAFRSLDHLSTGLIDVEVRVVRYGNNKYVKLNRAAPSGKMYLSSSSSKKVAAGSSKNSSTRKASTPADSRQASAGNL